MAKMRNDKLREEFDAAEPVRLTDCAPSQEPELTLTNWQERRRELELQVQKEVRMEQGQVVRTPLHKLPVNGILLVTSASLRPIR
jgi:hypothetical protein